MIHLTNITKVYPDKTLFKELNLLFKPDSRVGLVGVNGSGKTTLLRMIVGEEELEQGSVQISSKISIGYLPQEINSESDQTILMEVLNEIPEIAVIEEQIESISSQIALDPDNENLLNKLGHLQTEYERLDGWSIESRARKVLGGLGFSPEQMSTSLDKFSGGWRMRVALAKLLFKQPDILLLDEPTNHLDLASLIWLETFLKDWKGALVLISHDRTFLDKTINQIAEIHQKNIQNYSGNYTQYVEQKQLRNEQQIAAYKNQQKLIAETERFIERFRYKDSKASQVQSRVKVLEKLERVLLPEGDHKRLSVRIPQPGRSSRILAEFIGTSKSYDTVHVFQDLNLIVERGQKIGLVGPNGAGKSTLLKMLAQVEMPTRGQLNWGSEVNSAYFAQHQFESLPLHKTIYELISHENPKWTINEVRTYLGSFLFSGDTIEKPLNVLSGGEISRLALAKMLATPSHLILLDEPTNHLDVQARDVVQEAISSFTGSMVCISHDRHFLNSVTNTIIEVDGGDITIYPGNYDYYLWRKQQEKQDTPTIQPEQAPIESRDAGNNYAERKKLSNRLKKLPVLISQCEDDLADQDKILNDGSLASEYEKIQAALDRKAALEEEYLKLLEEQEVLKSKFE